MLSFLYFMLTVFQEKVKIEINCSISIVTRIQFEQVDENLQIE